MPLDNVLQHALEGSAVATQRRTAPAVVPERKTCFPITCATVDDGKDE